MAFKRLVLAVSAFALLTTTAAAQHCAPIVESYLSAASVKHDVKSIQVHVEYSKTGGRRKDAYQGYLIAYLDRDAAKAPGDGSGDLLDPKVVLVLDTALIKVNATGDYEYDFTIADNELANRVIEHAKLTKDDQTSNGGWDRYKNAVRLAFVVPFLEDEKHSTLPGLPADRHECNYRGERALVFQELPFELTIHFNIVQAVQLPEGEYSIQINSARPARPATVN